MTARVTAPYGSWPSPITAADVAQARLRLSFPTIHGQDVWWQETRPDEGGRTTIMHHEAGELLPVPWNARTRVHEYGGRAYLPVPSGEGHAIVFANYDDQRLYRLAPGDAKPQPLTPEPSVHGGLRYADFVLAPGGSEIWCVREEHTAGKVRRAIVAVPLEGGAADDAGAVRELVSGADFYAYPTPSPSGGHLAWVQWNHPRMPWDGTELRVGAMQDGVPVKPRTVKGGLNESVLAPAWCDDRSLYVVSDWSGWWNIYQVGLFGESPHALYPAEEEFAEPLWQLGGMPYAVLDDGRIVVMHGQGDKWLGIYDPETAELEDLGLPYADWDMGLYASGSVVVGIAGGPASSPSLVRVDVATGSARPLRQEVTDPPDAAYLPVPRDEVMEGRFGRPVYASVFPPTNPAMQAPEGELPPYVVFVHGGPTGRASSVLRMERAYFTSRGIGVVEVNYGGSTGFGRAYRERLRKQWGVVDVEDVVAVAEALVKKGEADPDRLAIRGGSAGGWTTLAAVTQSSIFKAAASYFGISDLKAFAAETHDFESRYLFGLIGPLPGFDRAYEERSPLTRARATSCPVLLLQGLEDPIVPPAQSEKFAAALAETRTPYAYLTFEGESHGFRRADSVIAALEAELSFYGQTLGFKVRDVKEVNLVIGRPPAPSRPAPPPPPES